MATQVVYDSNSSLWFMKWLYSFMWFIDWNSSMRFTWTQNLIRWIKTVRWDSHEHTTLLDELSKEGCLKKAIGDAAAFLKSSSMNRLPCACCNELRAIGDLKIVNPKGDWLIRLINRLNWRHTTHKVNTYTKEFYCVTPDVLEVIPELNELPLAPKGVKIVHIIDKEASVQVIGQ